MGTPPELTPQRVFEIKILLIIAGVLVTAVWLPFVPDWIAFFKKRFGKGGG